MLRFYLSNFFHGGVQTVHTHTDNNSVREVRGRAGRRGVRRGWARGGVGVAECCVCFSQEGVLSPHFSCPQNATELRYARRRAYTHSAQSDNSILCAAFDAPVGAIGQFRGH